ncbi:hypothetical protein FACS1894204_01860 [Synergistales bacterium]|nr:hypothetical protein FACS1894204_01860 [Synergistales bacterium]
MSGIFSRNSMFKKKYISGVDDLPVLENRIFGEEAVIIPVWDSYEIAVEEDWAQFINVGEVM